APIQRAIEAGDSISGVTIMQMDAGLDTGPIVSSASIPIASTDTAGSLSLKLADAGATAAVEALRTLAVEGTLTHTPQSDNGATYARKVTADEARVRWTQSALAIERKLRAFDPTPGAYAALNGERIKLWRAEVIPTSDRQQPGTITSAEPEGIDVACSEGALRVVELQPAAQRWVNALLRRYLREKPAVDAAIRRDAVARWSYPRWWIDRVQADFPGDWESMLEAGNARPPLTLRVNRRVTTRAAFIEVLD